MISEHAPKTLLGSVAHFSPEQLKTYYNVAVDGTTRFAGRTCRIVSIKPTDDYRYGYRMWVDKQTDLPLKLSLRYDGDRLEQLMFTDVAFPKSVPDDAFVSSYDVRGFKVVRHQSVHLADDTADDNSPNWHIRNLPPGFRLAENGPLAVMKIKEGVVRSSGETLERALEIENEEISDVFREF